MISIHNSRIKKIQANYKNAIEKQRTDALNKLESIDNQLFDNNEVIYLNRIINLFRNSIDNNILCEPNEINNQIINIGPIPPNSRVNGLKNLKKHIIDALNYKSIRNSFYPKYFNDIGIKACVYCNSQLTITANKKYAKFDVDHYHSKDEYPFLSISLFNLYPSCASCNRLKSTKKVKFELYTDDVSKTKKSDYKFKLESNAKAKYLTTKDKNSIEFTFCEPDYSALGYYKFNDRFHIEGIYKTQLDLIEELIIKSQVYNENYLKSLKNSFGKLNLNPELFKRMLVGNYTEDKDIHKRPMSKLVMDIAKELELIK